MPKRSITPGPSTPNNSNGKHQHPAPGSNGHGPSHNGNGHSKPNRQAIPLTRESEAELQDWLASRKNGNGQKPQDHRMDANALAAGAVVEAKDDGPRPGKKNRGNRHPSNSPFVAGNPWRFPRGSGSANPGGRPKIIKDAYKQILAAENEEGVTGAALVAEVMMNNVMQGDDFAAREMRQATEGDTLNLGNMSDDALWEMIQDLGSRLQGLGAAGKLPPLLGGPVIENGEPGEDDMEPGGPEGEP